ncbi:MAG: hypothetical protein H6707_08090 [Deltaproteobacteria bacterium]|nr:hypothetical protein [Deltaproteobacteria bacterium]
MSLASIGLSSSRLVATIGGLVCFGIVGLLVLVAACSEPNLGTTPFLCNVGGTECPDGYACDRTQDPPVCRRGGVTPRDAAAGDAGSVRDASSAPDKMAGQDSSTVVADGTVDANSVDQFVPPADSSTPVDSGDPPPLLCQDNAQCTGSSRCCCPIKIAGLEVKACLPLCLNPICF